MRTHRNTDLDALRSVRTNASHVIQTAERKFILKHVEILKPERVVPGGQRVGGSLDWREAGP